jgi:arsenate reductase-like glutaredoxin family protein
MVLLGGIGPQGHGFTYSTPKKEVIEICSDIKENNAILIKYKKFLKNQFLNRLKKELSSLEDNLKSEIIEYLETTLNQKELIGYNKKDHVLQIISKELTKFTEILNKDKIKIENLIEIISNALSIILRPINMVDQFKCRLDLINEGKLNSEDVAKLTSLKGKSHYDVLKERLFFQYITDWFYELYLVKKTK